MFEVLWVLVILGFLSWSVWDQRRTNAKVRHAMQAIEDEIASSHQLTEDDLRRLAGDDE